jgi:hypothetical protein
MSGTVGDNTARASGVIASAGGGTILSVKSLAFKGVASRSGSSPGQLSDFDMSFAPTTSDGKLYFQACLGGVGTGTNNGVECAFYFYDDTNSTIIGAYADAVGSRLQVSWKNSTVHEGRNNAVSFGCWHEPGTTDSIDYTIYGAAQTSYTLYINKNHYNYDVADIDSAYTASTFTITEYAADAVTLT